VQRFASTPFFSIQLTNPSNLRKHFLLKWVEAFEMNEKPEKKRWTAGMNGDTPPRHMIHGHLQQQNEERLQEMMKQGVAEVQVICASNDECPACLALEGKIFRTNDTPPLPPERCTCEPHCTCILTAIAAL